MSPFADDRTFDLMPGRSIELQDAAQFEITSLAGNLWITQIGDPRDTVVEEGQSAVVSRPGAALISALGGPARVQTAVRHQLAVAA